MQTHWQALSHSGGAVPISSTAAVAPAHTRVPAARPHTPTMNRKGCAMKLSYVVIAAAFFGAAPAMAQDVSVAMSTYKLVEVETEGGTEIARRALDSVLPGDTILYRLNITNTGEEAATDVAMTLPVDAAMILVPDSFDAEATLDVTFATRDAPAEFDAFRELTVPTEDGGTRPARPEDLGAARAEIAEVPAEAEAFVEYTARVR